MSCSPGGTGAGLHCGLAGTDDCCGSLEVAGGAFDRDGDSCSPATVGNYRLDAYEVTVGRFRNFVGAWDGGWRPTSGSGVHAHVNGGLGLQNNGAGHGYEPGWQSVWNSHLATFASAWDENLACASNASTWTSSPTASDDLPIDCVNWFEAYAFCIWDDAFLPSEAEFNYAYMGGSAESSYPWGSSSPGANTVLAAYDCYFVPAGQPGAGPGGSCGLDGIAPVGSSPAGNGRWGQSDLAGNMWEWLLDYYANPYTGSTCVNCTDTTDPGGAESSSQSSASGGSASGESGSDASGESTSGASVMSSGMVASSSASDASGESVPGCNHVIQGAPCGDLPNRTLRGGGYDSDASYLGSTVRQGYYPNTSRFSYYGFRCARTP